MQRRGTQLQGKICCWGAEQRRRYAALRYRLESSGTVSAFPDGLICDVTNLCCTYSLGTLTLRHSRARHTLNFPTVHQQHGSAHLHAEGHRSIAKCTGFGKRALAPAALATSRRHCPVRGPGGRCARSGRKTGGFCTLVWPPRLAALRGGFRGLPPPAPAAAACCCRAALVAAAVFLRPYSAHCTSLPESPAVMLWQLACIAVALGACGKLRPR